MRVLVIDDEHLLLKAVARLLSRQHEVVTVSSGEEGLVCLANSSFDGILCDLHLVGMDGEAFVAALAPSTAAKVVFMTGFLDPDARPSRPVLEKPFSPQEIFAALEEVERATRREAASPMSGPRLRVVDGARGISPLRVVRS